MNDTPTRVLDAVDVVIGEHGPSGVTLRRVGTEAGLSHTAAAHYYKDKTGLFTAYITRAYDRVGSALEEAATATEPREAMLAAAEAYARFAIDSPSAFSVMSRLELTHVETPGLWAARERSYVAINEILERNQRNGWAQGRELRDLSATTWAFVHGFVDLWVGGPLAAPYDGAELLPTLRQNFDAMLNALA